MAQTIVFTRNAARVLDVVVGVDVTGWEFQAFLWDGTARALTLTVSVDTLATGALTLLATESETAALSDESYTLFLLAKPGTAYPILLVETPAIVQGGAPWI